MEPRARTVEVTRLLKYSFSRDEIVDIARQQADAAFSRNELEAQLDSIKADFKGRLGLLETSIDKAQRKIRDGYEMRDIECVVQFHTPVDGQKRIVRLDTGEEVAIEYMLPHERQEILPFVNAAEPTEEPQEATTAEDSPEVIIFEADGPRCWPIPNVEGVYDKQGADFAWDAQKGKLFAAIYSLELEDGWISSLNYSFGSEGFHEPLSDKGERYMSQARALLAQVRKLSAAFGNWNYQNAEHSTARKALSALGEEIEKWLADLNSRIDLYPKPNEDLAYPEDKAQLLRKDLGDGDYFLIKLLEVDDGVYQSNFEFKVGAFERTQQPITDLVEADERKTCIISECNNALSTLAQLAVVKTTKKAEREKLQAAIEAIEGYRDLVAGTSDDEPA